MRTAAIVLVFMMGCTERVTMDTDASTGATDTGSASDPSNPSDPSDPSDPSAPTTGDLDNPSGFCSPQAQDPALCPADYICCSDDPATTQGRLPNYNTQTLNDKYGLPIFSADNNVLSYSGQCVDIGEFPTPLANGCPVPCNPTWSETQVADICGVGTSCCPFQTVDPLKDCVIDPETSRWRAVRGSDIPALTPWGSAHTTNQDPQGKSCEFFASGGGGEVNMDVFVDCYEQLTVADQRGFCYAACDCAEDPCDMKNPDWVPRCG